MRTIELLPTLLLLAGCGGDTAVPATARQQGNPPAAPGGAALAPATASGSLTQGERTMPIAGAVASWSEGERSLDILLLPFEPSPEEAEKLAGKWAIWPDASKNPDPETFERCPYGRVRFRFRQTSGTPDLAKADALQMELFWLDPEMGSTSLSLAMNDERRRQLAACSAKVTGSGGTFDIRLEGSFEMRKSHSWTIEARGPVHIR